MKVINLEKYKFRLRSLPNSKTFSRYFEAYMYFFAIYLAYNFVTICLFRDGFMPSLPVPFVLAIPLLFLKIYSNIEYKFRNIQRDTIKDVIILIRLKQNQSLREKLEDHPEMLTATYKKKSLLYWAKHHKNVEANSLIISLMKKKNKVSADLW